MEQKQHREGSKVRVGVVGLGDWGENHIQSFQSLPHAEVLAVCDINEDRTRQIAEKYKVRHAFTDYRDLCKHGDLDLVSVVTYEKNHLDPVLRALKAGKHVLVEKPVSTLAQEVQQMERTAREEERIIVPGHVLRFDSRYASIYNAIQNGNIGRPVSMYFKRSRQRSNFINTYKRTHTVYMSTVHDIDMALWYTGSRVRKVKAWGKKVAEAEVPDLLWAMLEFENGMIAVFESDWLTPDQSGIGMNDSAEIIGESGILNLNATAPGIQCINDSIGITIPDVHIHSEFARVYHGALTAQMDYICRCILENKSPDYTSFADALHGIEVANAIERAIESGAEIQM